MVRLASAYSTAGKYDEAVATIDKVLAMPDVHPQVKQVASAEKARALTAKAGGGPKPAPTPQVPQVEIKK